MREILKKEILYIRDLGLTNMFDTDNVKDIARWLNFKDLIKYINDNTREYIHFILTGDDTIE